jgi:hypothetical protein
MEREWSIRRQAKRTPLPLCVRLAFEASGLDKDEIDAAIPSAVHRATGWRCGARQIAVATHPGHYQVALGVRRRLNWCLRLSLLQIFVATRPELSGSAFAEP